MKIKVIIYDGVVEEILTDGPADVEVVDVGKNSPDHARIEAYHEELRERMNAVEFSYKRFE